MFKRFTNNKTFTNRIKKHFSTQYDVAIIGGGPGGIYNL